MRRVLRRRSARLGRRRRRSCSSLAAGEALYAPSAAREAVVGEVPAGYDVAVLVARYFFRQPVGVGFRAVSDQAAVAVENARLFSEARGEAAIEERQKLARELHDS